MAVDSTPQGAQVAVDGQNRSQLRYALRADNLQPGQHSITVSKPGYWQRIRARSMCYRAIGRRLWFTGAVDGDAGCQQRPCGANIYVDGRDMATDSAQVSVDKGQHVVLVRKMGYIDETMMPTLCWADVNHGRSEM